VRAGPPSSSAGPGPIVILGYPHSGIARLQRIVADCPGLACTSGTGLLPLCEQAIAAWRKIDDRSGQQSSLALASVRAMADSMITAILVRAGGSRWCEICVARASCAHTFLRLYPAARFLCLHRSCPDVIRSAILASPWGLVGTPFTSFASAYPASPAAAVAAWWAACTEPLLDFEQAHPGACHRVRHDEMISQPGQAAADVLAFLGITPGGPAAPSWMTGEPEPDTQPTAGGTTADGTTAGGTTGDDQVRPVVEQIPPPLREQVSKLQARIGYPGIG
jgi:Sulfotransferase family